MLNIPMFLSSDNNYSPFVATTIASICDNTNSFCNFYVLDGGISDENKDKIYQLKKLFNNFSVDFIKIDTEKYFKDFIVESYITVATYYRFIIADLFPNLEKVLYLDVDIIANGDVFDLYNIDLGDWALGAIVDQGNKNYIFKLKKNIDMDVYSNYFNAGVLLLDLKKWREQNIPQKVFDIEKKYRGKLLCNDQDVLNKFFENNYKQLPVAFNSMLTNENAIIRHFYNKNKPWHFVENLCEGEYEDFKIFWKYAKLAGITAGISCKYKTKHQIQILNLFKAKEKMKIPLPKVSVIIPVYNTEKYLRKCLDSVVNQTLEAIEIICVNDCSTDGSLQILKEYQFFDNRIKIIDFKENKGAAIARNIGIDEARGEYIGFVDSDDFIDLDFYEKLYNIANETNADAVKGNYKDAQTKQIDFSLNEEIKKDKNNFAFAYCSAIFKKKIIDDYSICFPLLLDMEDPIFTLQFALRANNVLIVDSACVNIVKRNDSLTKRILSLRQIKDRFIGLEQIINLLNNSNIKSETYIFVASFWFWQTYVNSIKYSNKENHQYIATHILDLFNLINLKEQILLVLNKYSESFSMALKNADLSALSYYIEKSPKEKIFSALRSNLKKEVNCAQN